MGVSVPPSQGVVPFGSGYDRLAIGLGDDGHLVELATLVQIHTHLEKEIQRQEVVWGQRQKDFFTALGQPVRPITVERVDPQNFYFGARPSLLQSPISFWPSITARCGDARPHREQYDTTDQYDLDLYIEILCKVGPIPQDQVHKAPGIQAQGDVNVQVALLSGAVLMCIRSDPTLGGVVQTIQNPPRIRPSWPDVQDGVDPERSGDSYIYMGRQLAYVVNRISY